MPRTLSTEETAKIEETIRTRAERQLRRFEAVTRGMAPRHCPICNYHGMFTPYGSPPRIDAHCAKCGSLERHRLYALMIQSESSFSGQDKVLHFAAEHHIRRMVRPKVASYQTAEIRESSKPALERRP